MLCGNKKGYNYFIGYKASDCIRPLHIMLPQRSEYIKWFDESFIIKDINVLQTYKGPSDKVRILMKKGLW